MIRHLTLIFSFFFSIFVFGQDISMYKSYLGNYDFTMIGNTMNLFPNGSFAPCVIGTSSSATLMLEPDQEIVNAFLYWGGSGSTSQFDFDIKLNGTPITHTRTFSNILATRAVTGAFADVTALVKAGGNGNYTVSDFDLSAVISDYCDNGTNFGGWSILVVYTDPDVQNNLLNIYDGFVRVDQYNTMVEFQLENLNVLNLVGNKIAYLAYEGDEDIAENERLKINGNIVSDPPLNPPNNVFNGTNSFTGSNTLYNMDLDLFNINDYTSLGDNILTVSLESHQDAVIIHNIALVLNSEVPDATIEAEAIIGECDIRDITVDYVVYNTIATAHLPAGTPIAFYADDVLVGMSATIDDIPIGGSESGSIVLTIPENIPAVFTLKVVVDDDGDGNSTVIEYDEENNEWEEGVTLGITPTINTFDPVLDKCDTFNSGTYEFDLTIIGAQILGTQENVLIRYYEAEDDASAGNNNNISNPTAYTAVSNPQTIYVRLEDTVGCNTMTSFQIELIPQSEMDYELPDLQRCSPDESTTGILFDLTLNDTAVLNGNNPLNYTVSYFLNQADAQNGLTPVTMPEAYANISNPQTVWARLEDNEGCVEFGSFELLVSAPQELTNEIPNLTACALTDSEADIFFNLEENIPEILNGENPEDYIITFHLDEASARNGTNPIANPEAYSNNSNPQTIWVRTVSADDCVKFGSFELIVSAPEELTHEISDLSVCALTDSVVGVIFNLEENIPNILNGGSPEDYIITFHLDEISARNGIAPIPTPEAYPNISDPETIWVRVMDEENCVKFGSFELFVIPVSSVDYVIDDFELCSADQTLIGIPTDLTLNLDEILNGADPLDYDVSFHHSESDARNGINPIADPQTYLNQSSPETIWVRLSDSEDCITVGSFELIYYPAPIAEDAIFEECGFGIPADFDLNEIKDLIVTDSSGLDFEFYSSQADAENQNNPLPEIFTPPTMNYVIYVRIIDENGCFTIVKVDLNTVVNTAGIDDIYEMCDASFEPNDGIAEFDLTSMYIQLNQAFGLSDSEISFYTQEEDAIYGINAIPDPASFANTSNPQTIYARVEGHEGDICGGIVDFEIEVLPVPEFDLDPFVAFCDYDLVKSYKFFGEFDSYAWFDPDGNLIGNSNEVIFPTAGIYTLRVTSADLECPAIREIEVIFDSAPIILEIFVDGHMVKVTSSGGEPPVTYSYDNGLTWHGGVFYDVPGGIYEMLAKSKYGCISEGKPFGVLGVPNVITPNGDGKNDVWEVRGVSAFPEANIKIFDRYGKKFVDRPLTIDFRWDGKYMGDPVASGDYWYLITLEDGKKIGGHISVRNQ